MGKHRNTFDSVSDGVVVPVVLYAGDHKNIIGEAVITQGEDGINADMRLQLSAGQPSKETDLRDVVRFLQGGIFAMSSDSLDDQHKEAKPNTLQNHKHKPIGHDDGLPAWCDVCGLTAGYLKPKPRMGKAPVRKHNHA